MRSIVHVEASGDGNVTSEDESAPAGKQHLFCYCWWRSAPEFDERGRPDGRLYPATVEEVSALTPRLRVLKEMERLAAVAPDSLDDLRHRLFSYRAGDLWLPTGGVRKEDVAIPPVVTVLLVGATGAGKSSLVNLMYSVLGRAGLIPFARTSPGGSGRTRCLEEHNVLRSMRNGFCVYDSSGFEYDRAAEALEEVAGWVEGGVRHRQPCSGGSDDGVEEGMPFGGPTPRYVKRKVNCVVVVANMGEIHRASKAGDMRPLEATSALFHSPAVRVRGEEPVLVLTHGDELTAEERVEGRLKVCEALGLPAAGGAYDVACLSERGLPVDELDPVTAYALTEAVYRALLGADRGHPPRRGAMEWVLCALFWLMWGLATFFAFLSYCCSKLAKRDRRKLKFM